MQSKLLTPTLLLALLAAPLSANAQVKLPFEGLLTDDAGMPITETFDVMVRLYDVPDGGTPIFEEMHTGVVPFDGYFFLSIGETETLDASLFGGELYVGITIMGDDTELAPRFAAGFVPFAVRALSADGGEIGPQGPQGEIGPVGPQGPQGDPGPTGPAGPTGAVGPDGATGPQGNVGPAGPTGAQGPQGNVGSTGAVGPVGPQGPQGNTGPQGPVGAVGPRGPTGNTGPQGNTGPAGPTGAQGPQGLVGATGPQGNVGPVGPAGPQGPVGNVGPQGPQGNTGPQGPTGATGAVGARGPTGPQGPVGPAGIVATYFSQPDPQNATVPPGILDCSSLVACFAVLGPIGRVSVPVGPITPTAGQSIIATADGFAVTPGQNARQFEAGLCWSTSPNGAYQYFPNNPGIRDNIQAGQLAAVNAVGYIGATSSPPIVAGRGYYVAVCARTSVQSGEGAVTVANPKAVVQLLQ